MRKLSVLVPLVAILLLFPLVASATDVPLHNWTVPSLSNSGSRSWVAKPEAETNLSGAIFFGLTPCRILDSRNAVGPFGGPKFTAGETRSYTMPAGTNPCTGIPTAAAYSLNVTIINYVGNGFVTLFPAGTLRPIVSTLNFGDGTIIANAAVVPANGSGAFSVFTSGATDVIIDVNGYYMNNNVLNPNTYFRVIGDIPGSLGLVFVNNINNTVASNAIFAVLQSNVQNGSAAIYGYAEGNGGITSGVKGQTDGVNGSSGVLGIGAGGNFTPSLGFNAGVRGLGAEATFGGGVIGEGILQGIQGARVTVTGGVATAVVRGALGYSTYGVYAFGDSGASGVKTFVEPHPTEAGKIIKYVSLEGPEAGTYFRGTARTVSGVAVIDVPESFRIVTDESGLTVQLTAVGAPPTMFVESENLNQIVVRSAKDLTFHYQVNGVRRAFKNWQAIIDGEEFMPDSANDRMPLYLTEEAKQRLIANGTYTADGNVNMDTARKLGWDKIWAARQGVPAAQPAPAANQ